MTVPDQNVCEIFLSRSFATTYYTIYGDNHRTYKQKIILGRFFNHWRLIWSWLCRCFVILKKLRL